MVEISLNLCDLCGRQSHGSVIEMIKEEHLDPWKKYRVCETCFKDIEIIIKDKMTGAHVKKTLLDKADFVKKSILERAGVFDG